MSGLYGEFLTLPGVDPGTSLSLTVDEDAAQGLVMLRISSGGSLSALTVRLRREELDALLKGLQERLR